MIYASGRVRGAGFTPNNGAPLFEGAAGADGQYVDQDGRRCVAVQIAATGGSARCVLLAGRSGDNGGFSLRREFDVTPQYNGVIFLNFKSMRVTVEQVSSAAVELAYGVLYDYPTQEPYLRRWTTLLAGVLTPAPEGARRWTPDVADTVTWTSAALGATMSQVVTGDATQRYPVLGEQLTGTLDNRILWELYQP